MVGNGFDLSLGMETDPLSFLSDFVNEHLSDSSEPAARLATKIQKDGFDKWSDYEKMLGEYSSAFKENEAGDYLRQKAELDRYLGEWLEKKNRQFKDDFISANAMPCLSSMASFSDKLPQLQKDLISSIRSRHSNEHWRQDIICFNYTDVLLRMYEKVGGKDAKLARLNGSLYSMLGDFIQPHGSLTRREIACGVDNIQQVANQSFQSNLEVQQSLIKPITIGKVFYRNDDDRAINIIRNANIICVFGMSFGKTDTRWWKEIASGLKSDNNKLLIIFSYGYSHAVHSFASYEKGQAINAVRESFYSALEDDSVSQSLNDRILVVDSSLLFQVQTTQS